MALVAAGLALAFSLAYISAVFDSALQTPISPWPGDCSGRNVVDHCQPWDRVVATAGLLIGGLVGLVACLRWTSRARIAAAIVFASTGALFALLHTAYQINSDGIGQVGVAIAQVGVPCAAAAAAFGYGARRERGFFADVAPPG